MIPKPAGRRAVGLALASLVVLLVIAWAVLRSGPVVNAEVQSITPDQAQRLGMYAAMLLAHDKSAHPEGTAQRALSEIAFRIGSKLDPKDICRWHLLDAPGADALAAPGHIVLLTGLVQETESSEELAGLMAHEIQHVLHQDALQNAIRALGWRGRLALLLGGSRAVDRQTSGILQQLTTVRFSPSQEQEADLAAVHLLQRAGIQPQGLASLYERLARQGAASPFMAAHHPTAERARRVRAEIDPLFDAPAMPYAWKPVQEDLRGNRLPSGR